MKSRRVGLLKQARNLLKNWSFRRNAISCYIPPRCRLLTNSGRLIQAENKRKQLCLQTELAEEKSQSLYSQKLPRWAQQINLTKEKSRTLKCYKKKVLYAGPKFFDKLNPSRVDPKNPAGVLTLHHAKVSF